MMPSQGDIILIPIPFTDLSSQKRRPVIVISNDSYNHKTTEFKLYLRFPGSRLSQAVREAPPD
jgi:hypothetical protein